MKSFFFHLLWIWMRSYTASYRAVSAALCKKQCSLPFCLIFYSCWAHRWNVFVWYIYQKQKRNPTNAKIWHCLILFTFHEGGSCCQFLLQMFYHCFLQWLLMQRHRGGGGGGGWTGCSQGSVCLPQCSVKAKHISWKYKQMLQFWSPIEQSSPIRCKNTLSLNCDLEECKLLELLQLVDGQVGFHQLFSGAHI